MDKAFSPIIRAKAILDFMGLFLKSRKTGKWLNAKVQFNKSNPTRANMWSLHSPMMWPNSRTALRVPRGTEGAIGLRHSPTNIEFLIRTECQ